MNKLNDRNIIYRASAMGMIWLAIWFLAAFAIGNDLILPGPLSTLKALADLICTGGFWLDVSFTILRVLAGALISLASGSLCAILAGKDKVVQEFFRLPVSFFKSVPVMAIIIYVILIVKADWVAVVVCFLMCFPIAYTNILNGLDSLDRKYGELSKIYRMTTRQRMAVIVRPELQPQIRAAADLIAGMSWKVVVAAEVLAIPGHSIGYQMLNSKYYLDTADLFAYIIVLIVLSLLMEKAVSYLVELDYKMVGARLRREVKKSLSTEASADTGPVEIMLDNVSKSYISEDGSSKTVLDSVTMQFGEGITALLGPSGQGKTTIMKLISGLEASDDGEVLMEMRVRGKMPDCRQKAAVDVLFQEDRLLPWLTVEENLLLAFLNRTTGDASIRSTSKLQNEGAQGQGACSKVALRKVRDMAARLEISDALGKWPKELSGGMAHRTALGRALLGGSRILIMDEPFRGLNDDLKKRIIRSLEDDIRYDRNGRSRTVVLITHDREIADEVADRTITLSDKSKRE